MTPDSDYTCRIAWKHLLFVISINACSAQPQPSTNAKGPSQSGNRLENLCKRRPMASFVWMELKTEEMIGFASADVIMVTASLKEAKLRP